MATAKNYSKKNVSKKNVTKTFKDTYQEVTDAVIKSLEEGTVVWQCPWNTVGFPKNITTDINYRGWNIFWLNFNTMMNNYTTPYYITYKQAQELGGTVKKGEKGTQITYWATIELKSLAREIEDQETGDKKEICPTKMVPKVHTVFNIDQTEGIEFPKFEALFRSNASKIQACENIIAEMPNKPKISLDGKSAYYSPKLDAVTVPSLEISKTNESFYSTLFHELAHSTGHASRLNRKELVESDGYGKTNYSKEELTAEMTAGFLCAITGIEQVTHANSAAYIEFWLKALKNDKTLILKAAAQAQKAADYILNVKPYEAVKAA